MAGYLSGSLAGCAEPAEESIDLAAELGADLLHWWEVPASGSPLITLNGSNVSQLDDRAGSADMVQATAANQPAYSATGGPNDRPYINLQDTARFIEAIIAVTTGHRVGIYAVLAHGATANRLAVCTRDAGAAGVYALNRSVDGLTYRHFVKFSGGTAEVNPTVPAIDTDFHVHAIRPLASGALSQIDGVTTTPDLAGTDTVVDMVRATFGSRSGGTSEGRVCSMLLVNDPTDAKDAIILAYYAQEYGL